MDLQGIAGVGQGDEEIGAAPGELGEAAGSFGRRRGHGGRGCARAVGVDAADADDDGGLNGVLDGLYVLNYQFIAGSPVPPAPGPFECGPDPNGDSASCDVYDPCP